MFESLYISILYFFGIGALLLIFRKEEQYFAFILGFPAGVAIYATLILILFLCNITAYKILISIVIILFFATGIIRLIKSGEYSRSLLKHSLPVFLLNLFLFILLPFFIYSIFTKDSFVYTYVGKGIYQWNLKTMASMNILQYYIERFLSRGIFLPIVHGMAYFWGEQYVSSFHSISTVTGTLAITYLLGYTLNLDGSSKRMMFLLCTCYLLSILSTFFIIFSSFVILPNLITGIYFTLSIQCFFLWIREKKDFWIIPGFLFLLAFILLRFETIFIAFVVITCLIAIRPSYQSRIFNICYLIIICILSGWYLLLLSFFGIEGGTLFLTGKRIILIILFMWLIFLINQLKQYSRILRKILEFSPHILILLGSVTLLYLTCIRLDHAVSSVVPFLKNLFQFYGLWGSSWVVVSFLCISLPQLPKIKSEHFLWFILISYFFFINILVFFRTPWYFGWTDSSNRMMLHIFPLILYTLIMKIGKFKNKKATN